MAHGRSILITTTKRASGTQELRWALSGRVATLYPRRADQVGTGSKRSRTGALRWRSYGPTPLVLGLPSLLRYANGHRSVSV
jgi:hypothetical protein